jgi:hypothetical protein
VTQFQVCGMNQAQRTGHKLVGRFFDSGMFIVPGANAQQIQFVLQYFCAKGAFLKIPHQLRSR